MVDSSLADYRELIHTAPGCEAEYRDTDVKKFARLVAQGYKISVVHIDPQVALSCGYYAGPNSKSWLQQTHRWSGHKNFYSHLTDYFRFVLLHKFGGVYSDMDAIALQRFPSYPAAAKDWVEAGCKWCLTDEYTGKKFYIAPGVMVSNSGQFSQLIESRLVTKHITPGASVATGRKHLLSLSHTQKMFMCTTRTLSTRLLIGKQIFYSRLLQTQER